jgi:hypothetical protein
MNNGKPAAKNPKVDPKRIVSIRFRCRKQKSVGTLVIAKTIGRNTTVSEANSNDKVTMTTPAKAHIAMHVKNDLIHRRDSFPPQG